MLKQERQPLILREINLHNRVLCPDLWGQINTSKDPVRRDLNELADEGKLIKVHGGAFSKSFHISNNSSNGYSQDESKTIAWKVYNLIEDGC